ncbi:A-kinase anchor protein 1, mitochondrial-like [Astyanax mexicanus]|uniref:A-kinase anchor protein 1, mitochondrial-like n=1 Tax=Astyanax mexicanus TaxID=7994 RepID=A0A8T2L258_ASTMX|nr:A-kinase anchor protein 1, mitochondrial-like [Astyanax mexicanus]
MLSPHLRPLVPLSALALLGCCWYAFRKRRRRNLGEQIKEEEASTSASLQSLKDSPGEQEGRTPQDLKLHYCLHAVETQEQDGSSSPSSHSDHNLNLKDSSPDSSQANSSIMDELPILHETLLTNTTTSTSTPRLLKGDRPEPEGEISEAQASALLSMKLEMENEKDSNTSKGHQDFKAGETNTSWPESDANSSVQQPPSIVSSKGHLVTMLSETKSNKKVEQVSASLVNEAIHAATEEILTTSDVILQKKDQLQTEDQDKKDISKNKALLMQECKTGSSPVPNIVQKDCATHTKTVEERIYSVGDLNDQSQVGEDSGCSTCHSEDWISAEEASCRGELWSSPSEQGFGPPVSVGSESKTPEMLLNLGRRNGNCQEDKADVSKGTNEVTCMKSESSSLTTTPPSSALTLWDIEVPAHLVGRLIGKQGRHVGFLKQNSGAKIYVSALPYTHEFQICHIEGSKVQVENALTLIRKKFKDLDLSNRRGHVTASLPSLPVTSWLLLPQDSPVEVIVPRVESANYLFVQQHTHPTYYALHSLNEQMLFCYSRPGCPSLPTPVEAGVVCAAPSADGGWWRAQVIQHFKDSDNVQIRYVDYGGYVMFNLSALRQIRSDFVALPFQGSEVMLENLAPLPGKKEFSLEAKEALEELTRGLPLIIKVTGTQSGLPLVHMWRQAGEQMVSVNGLLVERGLCSWLDSH